MNAPVTSALSTLHGHFAVLEFDGITLVLEQAGLDDVQTLEDRVQSCGQAGWFTLNADGQELPMLALDRQLRRLPTIGADRRLAAVLRLGEERLGLACRSLRMLRDATLRLEPLPACMQLIQSPVIGLTELNEAVAFVCDGRQLAAIAAAEAD
jgi:hypothetical protein